LFGVVNGSQDHELSKKQGLYFNIGHSKRDNEMKHILPILTLTTLAGAAFADAGTAAPAAPAASGLSYNRVGLSYVTGGDGNPCSLQASAFIGSSNVLVSAHADLTAAGYDSVSIGYVFKNIYAGADVTVAAATNDIYSIQVRRALSEVLSGLEVAVGYQRDMGSDWNGGFVYEVSYNINKQYSVAYSIQDPQGSVYNSVNSVSIRYNF
jgi:hypothetical protein